MLKKTVTNLFILNSTSLRCNRKFYNRPNFAKRMTTFRRGNYRPLQEEHIHFFQTILGDDRVVMDLSDLEKYNVDYMRFFRGSSTIVLKPQTTKEVSMILAFCNQNRLAVCPQGGNTGMVGGAIAIFDEIIISTELMNRIISLDDTSGALVAQAGCTLQQLDDYVARKNLIVPLDLGAKGSCHIGGNISTNAGGTRLVRYGNLHQNVLGLEIVKADGEIIDCVRTLKKDNTGYHLPHLFIGAEGTLGLITKVALHCPPRPKSNHVAFLGCQKYEEVLKIFRASKRELGEILSAFELIDHSSMDMVEKHLNLRSPIGDYPFYILIETSGNDKEHDGRKLDVFLEDNLGKKLILDGIVTAEPSKSKDLWRIRERIPEAFHKDGHVFHYDVSLPLPDYYSLVPYMKECMDGKAERVFGFGHIGDSNLHIGITMKEFTAEMKRYIEDKIYTKTCSLNGSISAEHGIGFAKLKYLDMIRSRTSIEMMRDLKWTMDPNWILNPYKTVAK